MSCRIVFFGHCGKRSSYTSQAEAETAAIEYGSAAGYACEAYLCDKHLSKTVIDKTILCWHFRAKSETAPPMTRTQWECRAAEYRVIEAKAAVERDLGVSSVSFASKDEGGNLVKGVTITSEDVKAIRASLRT